MGGGSWNELVPKQGKEGGWKFIFYLLVEQEMELGGGDEPAHHEVPAGYHDWSHLAVFLTFRILTGCFNGQ